MRKNIHLTDLQRSITIGTVLGDGSLIETFSKNNLRLQIDHCEAQKEYVFWKYNALRSLILTPPTYQRKNRSWRFRTISHPELTEIGKMFYQDRRKIVPKNLDTILTPLGLAVWFMDDGAYHSRYGCILNTQCYTYRECKKMQKILRRRFGICFVSIQKDHNGWRLYIGSQSIKKFRQLVRPYLLKNFMYKIGEPRRDYTLAPWCLSGVKI